MPLASWKQLTALALWVALGLSALGGADAAQAQDLTKSLHAVNGPDVEPSDELIAEWERTAKANSEGCRRKDPQACFALAYAYRKGQGVTQVRPIAEVLYRDACELGSLDACAGLADQLFEGDGIPEDRSQAEAVASLACEKDGSAACVVLARGILRGIRAPADVSRARGLLDTQCRAGVTDACMEAAMELEGYDNANQWQVGEYYYLACLAGDALGCSRGAAQAWQGQGIAPDPKLALFLAERGCAIETRNCEIAAALREATDLLPRCDAGEVRACGQLGGALDKADPVTKASQRARLLLVQACEAGEPEACPRAGELTLYLADNRDSPEVPQAMTLLEMGCAVETPEGRSACLSLSAELRKGLLVDEDMPRAAALLQGPCEAGEKRACDELIRMVGKVPDMPMIAADARYSPPGEFDKDGVGVTARAKPVIRNAKGCIENRERFRGKTYVDRICRTKVRSINGYRVRPGQAPWQALLWRPEHLLDMTLKPEQRVMCGGTVIRTGWILTAAHCLVDQGKDIVSAGHRVRLGVFNPRNEEGVTYPILRAIPHPDFNKKTYAFDIALVQYDTRKGEQPGPTNAIGRLALDPLPLGERTIAPGMEVFTYGWGWTAAKKSQSTDNLRGVKMELTSEERCTAITGFSNTLLNSALCAGGRGGQQACKGDSGGGLVYYGDADKVPKVIGVVSAGRACGTVGEPSRYTRVAKVRDWIEKYIGPLSRR